MEELIEEFKQQFAGDPLLERVVGILESSYKNGYQEGYTAGFVDGEASITNIVDRLISPSTN